MSNVRLIIIAVLSIGVSITLGMMDYETKSFIDLFTLENIPALFIFAAIAFTLLLVLSLLADAGRKALVRKG